MLYTAPSTSQFALGIELAKAALRNGYDVELFAWGDSVYATTRPQVQASSANQSVSELAGLLQGNTAGGPEISLHVCTSCYKTRSLARDSALPGAHLGGLHNIVGMFRECDRTLVLVP